MTNHIADPVTRRTALKTLIGAGGAAVALQHTGPLAALAAQNGPGAPAGEGWANQLGLQVYTVRDQLAKDFEGTLAKIAEAGYRVVEFAGSLGDPASPEMRAILDRDGLTALGRHIVIDRTPQQVRAILDRVGLTAVSTHIAAQPGPDLERRLEAWQIIGHRYTAVQAGPSGTGTRRPGAPIPPNVDRWHRYADSLNEVGAAGKKYGIRALVHNHTGEFEPLADTRGTVYDLLLSRTDPALVSMELDIGWAMVAQQDPMSMFRTHPGRFHLWHVKDVRGVTALRATPPSERQRAATFTPVGQGDIDYASIFQAANVAGLQHFFVEQDNARQGDSIAAMRASADYLKRVLR